MTEFLWISRHGEEPALDLSLESALLDSPPQNATLFTYCWDKPVLVVGYGQDPVEGIDLDACREREIPVYRRITGGTGVLNTGDLCVSLVLPANHAWSEGIRSLYDRFLGVFQQALSSTGFPTQRPEAAAPSRRRSPICFEDHTTETLLVNGRKVLGCTLTRKSDDVLVHGTLLLTLDASLQGEVYRVSEERIQRALGCLPNVDPERLQVNLAEAFARALGVKLRETSPSEATLQEAAHLSRIRYADPRWAPLHFEG